MLALSVLLGFHARLPQTDKLNLAAARGTFNVTPKVELGPESGRVISTVTYQVAAERSRARSRERCRKFAAFAVATARVAGC